MKPLGRKYFKCPSGSKHHIRVDGKYKCWWDEVCEPSKSAERRRANEEIEQEIERYETAETDEKL